MRYKIKHVYSTKNLVLGDVGTEEDRKAFEQRRLHSDAFMIELLWEGTIKDYTEAKKGGKVYTTYKRKVGKRWETVTAVSPDKPDVQSIARRVERG